MNKLPKEIIAIINRNSELQSRLPSPLLINDSDFLTALALQNHPELESSNPDEFHLIRFAKSHSRDRIAIDSDAVQNSLTNIIIKKGNSKGTVTLSEPPANHTSLSRLLSASIFCLLKKNIANIPTDATQYRRCQSDSDQSRFERVTEVILDSFECFPITLIDTTLRTIYLTRITSSNDDCHELYISQRLNLSSFLEKEWPNGPIRYYHETIYTPHHINIQNLLNQIMRHPVFSAFETLVTGRICKVLLTGNYSQLNTQRHRRFLHRVAVEIRQNFDEIFRTLDNGTFDIERQIKNPEITIGESNKLKEPLRLHTSGINDLKARLSSMLEEKIKNLDLLERIATKQNIDIYLINGAVLVNNHLIDPPQENN